MRVLVLTALCAACATSSPVLGRIALARLETAEIARTHAPPVSTVYDVGTSFITSEDMEARLEGDGCVRGRWPYGALQLCRAVSTTSPDGTRLENWIGPSGDVTLEVDARRGELRITGLLLPEGSAKAPLDVRVAFDAGPQWDSLRRHPALLAIAVGTAGRIPEPKASPVVLLAPAHRSRDVLGSRPRLDPCLNDVRPNLGSLNRTSQ